MPTFFSWQMTFLDLGFEKEAHGLSGHGPDTFDSGDCAMMVFATAFVMMQVRLRSDHFPVQR